MATSNQGSPMAAVGSYDSILPFKAIGLDVVEITDENRDSIGEIMNRFAIKGYAALFVEEALFSKYQQAVDEVNESTDMCIIPVPNQSGSMGVGLSSIRRNVERAVGMDIFGVK
ncbi:V-type sodium ATPase subunit G [bioreactor metagenome]|jgi:V/A-type H+-transporting ATPase subunit F|uniref:V-type sodium ATPase subunit G n=1 Tax=bioreactor metagenome TaxID=1076179 RepID=A0A645F1U0_9ZZZZ|nr:V-type ATP synthase subunit F [Synergistaceae bacterium]PKL05459.1 MAG: V-type ATP synthase subunit F [Synergistetes bacterium HGW-Synergistetes-1]MBP9559431.1 V-type ATP synthase subunit F [Synergistaceae bacterium]MBP9975162.1 V-type ATP synthase subunit F [Synergistaceae bacterium]MCE5183405.1 V-type ATP synthase subunit F [Synergistaceae bacterium]